MGSHWKWRCTVGWGRSGQPHRNIVWDRCQWLSILPWPPRNGWCLETNPTRSTFSSTWTKIASFLWGILSTRTEHLELFTTWLSQYKGPKRYAVDVGTGSGILSFLLLKNGFEQVLGTDMNPNALWSAQQDAQRLDYQTQFTTKQTDLINDIEPTSLIVFNPPWIPGRSHSSVDDALFFEQGLFTRFFDQATEKLLPDGRIVLIFSTILTLLRPDIPHPIETEVSKGRFRLLNKMQRKVKPTNGKRTKEKVQIWELSLNQ